ncbi:MAG: hypothetical protein QOI63_1838, partial [Thermoplasmata archaeon]|nr:hypothetical protein [Thermoplasmata archaeon]
MAAAVATAQPGAPSAWTRLRSVLPEGLELPRATWESRHRTGVVVILLQAAGLAVFGIYRGWGPVGLGESVLIGLLGLLASARRLSRRFRSGTAALACVTTSAVLTQFSGGVIEAHFHFFVMVALIALYQDWVPFLLAILYVAVDHGLIGTLAPQWVYNHADAVQHPWKWAAIHAVMVLAECGALVAFWGGAEQAKVRSDLVLDSAGEGIIGLGLDHKVAFINRSASALLGRRADDLVGQPLETHLRDAKGAPIAFPVLPPGRLVAAPRIAVEGAIVRSGAPALPVEWVVTPTLRAGVPVGHVVTLRDISERKRAEAELQGSLSMLTATLESTADAILVVDAGGRIVNFNQRFVAMWGIPPAILATRDDAQAVTFVQSQLKDPEAFLRKLRELYADGDAESVDVLEFNDGRVVERSSRPQRIGGRSVGRVWSFRDITEQRRAEERREQQMAAMRQVERLLEQDRFKTQLLNTASHELNTPISALRLQLHLLKSHLPPKLDERSQRGFQVLDRNVERLGALVRDTLDVARIEGGRLVLKPQPMDLARLAAETCQSMEGLAREKDVALAVEGVAAAPLVGDPARCTQVLFNLVANALKFTPAGGRVTVTVAAEGGKASVRVRDT